MADTVSAEWQVVSDVLCASGEAPFWSAREERLYWIDPPLKRAWRLHLPSGRAEHWGFAGPITGLTPCRSGGFLLLLGDGIYHAGSWLDVPTLLVPLPSIDANALWRAGTCDPWGRLWLIAQTRPAANRLVPSSTLYCLRARSTTQPPLEPIRHHVGDCLGLSWSPDGRSATWCNTRLGEVVQAALSQPGSWPPELSAPMPLARFVVNPGAPSAQPVAVDAAFEGLPRSGTLDQAGNYWVSLIATGRARCLNGQGRSLLDLAVPALYPSGLCLGGSDGRTLFVTSMRAGLSAAQLAHHPQSGAVFARRVETPGLPAPLYWD
ncbi:gluconolactonase [Serpentinimonas raichei]|jgi:sugar lactone lactonase YvrE|uniref:Gluconolactonase n=1 Tax=Serpentinimonas raichei TaxID=1458425 RepID=A0A060NK11_9BURK|nr:SMP-30/gluconolactonase/LRE family protein [Serpentinimonas raichei]BAO81982.1 gluconolactonase [Serpentinimonas raichei]